MIRIDAATPADVPLVLELIRALAEYEHLAHEVVASEEGLREELFSGRAVAEALIAREGDAALGFALFFHNFSTFLGRRGLYLEDLYVHPRHRGRGVGRLLLAHLARLAVERRCGRLEWAVLDWNEPAIRFYRGLGARAMDDWTVYRVEGEALARLAGPPPGGER